MMGKKPIKTLIAVVFLFSFLISGTDVALGSFGITPPFIRSNNLTPNSVYEQRITIVRGNPDIDLRASITWDVPGADDWISIDKGEEFILPAGEQKVSMVVSINVPRGADYNNYSGHLRITTSPADTSQRGPGAVAIALGARVDVNFDVVDNQIMDFDVRRVQIADLNEKRKVLWLTFPGKIQFTMTLANTGNVPAAPDRVEFDIYDSKEENLLESTVNKNKLSKQGVAPFRTNTITADIPTFLPAGRYVAHYRIYGPDDEIKQGGSVNLSVLPEGTLEDDDILWFAGLSTRDKGTILVPLFILLAGAIYAIRRRIIALVLLPGRFIKKIFRRKNKKSATSQTTGSYTASFARNDSKPRR